MRLIIVSNRAPVSIHKENGNYRYTESSGGLASGLRAYVQKAGKLQPGMEIVWIGWPGDSVEDEEKVRQEIYKEFGVHSVFLSPELMDNFYEGFCNKTIWPLFHYFPMLTMYEKSYWNDYKTVNELYSKAVMDVAREGDVIWVHDYHLMLLPEMLRKKMPDATIGFFLHIPFPSYEIFRLLPGEWRMAIIKGLYGADLIGFHTYDYCTYFIRTTLHILGLTDHMGEIIYENRTVKIDTFPMGIDFNKYHEAAKSEVVAAEIAKLQKDTEGRRVILSIDRQDYSKGILNRLKGYEFFLENNPDWMEKVILIMIVVPSRIGVESYQSIKSNIDELVGHINSKYGKINWMPIVYRYSSVNFEELIALYTYSDVALITPIRDGMNLIAKEYIACRVNGNGVLILSEMAGAAAELIEAILINPNNKEEIGLAIRHALSMSTTEQKQKSSAMMERIKKHSIFEWADDFLNSLRKLKVKQKDQRSSYLDKEKQDALLRDFITAPRRLLFLDYDGTLLPFTDVPENALPDEKLLYLITGLSSLENTQLIIISGRSRVFLENIFGHLPVSIIAEHGHFVKQYPGNYELLKPIRKNWKKKIYPILQFYIDKLPGSFIEEKEYSLVFHYRRSSALRSALLVKELMHHLINYTSNLDIQISMMKGNKVLEVSNSGVDKGVAAMKFIDTGIENTFILAAGDDYTDENTFRVMPENAYTIKIGNTPSKANYSLSTSEEFLILMGLLLEKSRDEVMGMTQP